MDHIVLPVNPPDMTPPSGYVGLFIDQATGRLVRKDSDGNIQSIGVSTIVVSGTSSPNMNGTYYPVGEIDGKTAWSTTAHPFSYPPTENGGYIYSESGAHFTIDKIENGTRVGLWISSNCPSRPDAASGWSPDGVETGDPVLTFV